MGRWSARSTRRSASRADCGPGTLSRANRRPQTMSDEATRPEQVADEAEAVLHRVQHTVYTHDTHVDVATGTYNMDCSGYVGYVLQRCALEHFATISNSGGSHGPLAIDFYNRFVGLPPEGADGW